MSMLKEELDKALSKKVLIVTITTLVFMVLVKSNNIFSFFIAHKVYPFLKSIDPDRVFMTITVHHIVQAVIGIFAILIISKVFKISLKDFGFNLNDYKYSIKEVLRFCGIWALIQGGVGTVLIMATNMPASFGFAMNVRNFTGYFLFQILLSGTSEEIIFRSLVITVMMLLWKRYFREDKNLMIAVIAASTWIFMFDHINFAIYPFRITHFSILQQVTCLIAGVFYGHLFVKTKSIFGPILAHNLLNGVITTIGLILYCVFS